MDTDYHLKKYQNTLEQNNKLKKVVWNNLKDVDDNNFQPLIDNIINKNKVII